jgi:hypothetical protein
MGTGSQVAQPALRAVQASQAENRVRCRRAERAGSLGRLCPSPRATAPVGVTRCAAPTGAAACSAVDQRVAHARPLPGRGDPERRSRCGGGPRPPAEDLRRPRETVPVRSAGSSGRRRATPNTIGALRWVVLTVAVWRPEVPEVGDAPRRCPRSRVWAVNPGGCRCFEMQFDGRGHAERALPVLPGGCAPSAQGRTGSVRGASHR